MPPDNAAFKKLKAIVDNQGPADGIEFLISHFRNTDDHHQLFESLKMKVRWGLGLPILYGLSPDQMDDKQQRQLEDGLLDACREVGTRLFEAGQLREGWMYLQPLGDRKLVEELISRIEVTEDNTADLIEIGLSQGASPELGYRLVLQRHGTCNAITTFDTQIGQLEKPVRKQLAAMLVDHLYNELVTNVRNNIEKHDGKRPTSRCLAELTAERAWLTADGAHHIDTTHLASIMRIGRIVDLPATLQQLLELANYGRELSQDYQYPGSAPFEDTYHDHALFYLALCGADVESAIKYFEEKVKTTDRSNVGLVAVETLVDLLLRTDHRQQAIDVAINQLLGQSDLTGIAPNIFEIASEPADFRILMDHYQRQNDLLGFSIGLLRLQKKITSEIDK